MSEKCDYCKETVHRSQYGGWWEGDDNTSECDANPGGHEVDGQQR